MSDTAPSPLPRVRVEPRVSGALTFHSLLVLFARAGLSLGQERRTLARLINSFVIPRSCPTLRRYTPGPSDVFVTTFVKSGTNWAMQICQQLASRGAAEFEHIHRLVPWPEVPARAIVRLDDPGPARAAPTGLRVIKTHLLAEGVPITDAARYLAVIRDPADVLVSAYHFIPAVMGIAGRVSPQRWLEINLGAEGLLPRWVEHSAGYWALRERPNVYLCSFSDLLRDLPGRVDAIAEWMGVELEASERSAVLERSSFAYMKSIDHAFAPPRSVFAPLRSAPVMMRSGKSRGGRELYSPREREQIDALCREGLRRLGSDLPYDELFER